MTSVPFSSLVGNLCGRENNLILKALPQLTIWTYYIK